MAQVLFADWLAGPGAQHPGGAYLLAGGAAAELAAQVLGRGQDQGLEDVDCSGAGLGSVFTSGQQDPQRFAGLPGARQSGMGAGQRLAGGADGVQLIGFAAPAAGALGPVRLDHRVPGRGEGGGQAGAVEPQPSTAQAICGPGEWRAANLTSWV